MATNTKRGPRTGRIMGAGAVGALAVGLFLGYQFKGVGVGEGEGVGQQQGVGVATEAVKPAAKPLGPAPEQAPEPTIDGMSATTELLVVRIGNDRYLTHRGDGQLVEKTLEEVVDLASATTGTDDGLRVRIERTQTARAIDQERLKNALADAGLKAEEIQQTGDFVDGQ